MGQPQRCGGGGGRGGGGGGWVRNKSLNREAPPFTLSSNHGRQGRHLFMIPMTELA